MRMPPGEHRAARARARRADAPPPVTAALVQRGRERFDIHCAVCHGYAGDGDSVVASKMSLRGPPTLHRRQGARLHGRADLRRRPPRATATCRSTTRRSSAQDRWAIANYIKALQLSQHASLDDVPADKRGELDKPADGSEEAGALGEQGMSAATEIVLPRAPWDGGRRNMIVAGARRRHRPRAVVRVDELRHARARRLLVAVGLLLLADAGRRRHRLAVRVPRRQGALDHPAAPHARAHRRRRRRSSCSCSCPSLFCDEADLSVDRIPSPSDRGGAAPLRAPPRLHEPRACWIVRARHLLRRLRLRLRAPAAPVDGRRTAATQPLNTLAMWRLGAGLAAVPRLRHQLRRLRLADVAQRHLLLVDVRPLRHRRLGDGGAWRCWILVSIARQHADERPPPALDGQAAVRLHLLLGATRRSASSCSSGSPTSPTRSPWFHMRLYSDWRYVGYFLVAFHFALPFVILLVEGAQVQHAQLGFMAVWMLVAHAVDIYWIVLPQISPTGPHVQPVGPVRLRRRRRPGASASSSGACAAACWCRSAIRSSPRRWSITREPARPRRRPRSRPARSSPSAIVSLRHLRRRRGLVDLDPARRDEQSIVTQMHPAPPAEAGAPEVGIVYQWPFNAEPVRRREGGRHQGAPRALRLGRQERQGRAHPDRSRRWRSGSSQAGGGK